MRHDIYGQQWLATNISTNMAQKRPRSTHYVCKAVSSELILEKDVNAMDKTAV